MSEFVRILQRARADHAKAQSATPVSAFARPAISATATPPPVTPRAPRGTAAPPPPTEPVSSLDGVEGHLISLLDPTSVLAEPYRVVRHLLEQLHLTGHLSIVAVSSPAVAEGKTTTAINLAGALAQSSEARVLLVDADLRTASMARHLALGRAGRRGLVDLILDTGLGLDEVVIPRSPFNLDVLPAGAVRPDPYEVLKSPRLGDLLKEARRRYDFVILDTAPLGAVPDSLLIDKWIDGFLLVVAAHRTPRKLVAETLDLIDPDKLIALLFNADDERGSRYSYPAGMSRPRRST
jgi:capsular exopolysaccharide synthesis family protein